jgi:hypothetical protein
VRRNTLIPTPVVAVVPDRTNAEGDKWVSWGVMLNGAVIASFDVRTDAFWLARLVRRALRTSGPKRRARSRSRP